MKWPAESPDLNPIENIRGLLKQSLRALPKQPTTCDQLFSILQSDWDSLADSYLSSVVASMATCVREVISTKGESTKY